MKKLLFVLVFAFIGQQAFSQMYMMVVNATGSATSQSNPLTCAGNEIPILIVEPNGTETYNCIPDNINDGQLGALNIEINNILNLGYKLIETYVPQESNISVSNWNNYKVRSNIIFLFAKP
jgi:hypothetical protein